MQLCAANIAVDVTAAAAVVVGNVNVLAANAVVVVVVERQNVNRVLSNV